MDMNLSHLPGLLWTPLRIRPRREKKCAEFCRGRNVACYLPLRHQVKRYQRRNVESLLPMFPGYLFCALDEEGYQRIVISGYVAGRLTVDHDAERRLIEELNAVRRFEALTQVQTVIVMPELASGRTVVVRSGPLRGVSGIVTHRKGATMVAINIDLLGQSVAAEIDVGELELEA